MRTLLSIILVFSSVYIGAYTVLDSLSAYNKADSIIKILTIDEKIQLTRGYSNFFIRGFKNKDIPTIYLSDATQGVNIRRNLPDSLVTQLEKSTAFPAPILLASTFNPELSYKYAKAVGEECRAGGIEFLLGPGLNIYRQSQCGRNFEYFGEDPYLVSQMVSQYVRGIQSTGTAACLKHFFGNNTEFYRKRSNSIISERAMHEIYLPGFKAGIEAGAMSVMTSYNQINGEWTGQSDSIIKRLLREELGFKWLVMSDWNSVWDLRKVVKSGLNLEMPGTYDFGITLYDLYKNGEIAESDIDDMIRPTIATCVAMGFYDRDKYKKELLKTFHEHEILSEQVAEEGIILLRNENEILPLKSEKTNKILLTGKFVYEIPRGYGAAEVVGYNNISMFDALKEKFGDALVYVEKPTVEDLKSSDVVLLSIGCRDRETIERPFALPDEEESFIKYIVDNSDKVIGIVNAGSGIRMSGWNEKMNALIYGWYPGQSGFRALADIIVGNISPSGKLPISIEKEFNDSPAYGYLPKGHVLYKELYNEQMIKVYDINYSEDILVGYRWYETKGIKPLYPFGYGLSYSKFKIYDFKCDKQMKDNSIDLSVRIKNISDIKGAEVLQVYIKEISPTVLRPNKELKEFKKVKLDAGKSVKVNFSLDKRDFSFWDDNSHEWKTNKGKYEIMLGTSVSDILYTSVVEIK